MSGWGANKNFYLETERSAGKSMTVAINAPGWDIDMDVTDYDWSGSSTTHCIKARHWWMDTGGHQSARRSNTSSWRGRWRSRKGSTAPTTARWPLP